MLLLAATEQYYGTVYTDAATIWVAWRVTSLWTTTPRAQQTKGKHNRANAISNYLNIRHGLLRLSFCRWLHSSQTNRKQLKIVTHHHATTTILSRHSRVCVAVNNQLCQFLQIVLTKKVVDQRWLAADTLEVAGQSDCSAMMYLHFCSWEWSLFTCRLRCNSASSLCCDGRGCRKS